VTVEIAAALTRKIRVIPVLVDGARTPKAEKLPDSVKPLVRRNAVEVRNTNFGRDAEALANKLREALIVARPATRRWPFVASATVWLMAPGQWRTVAGSATALLLVGWVGLYQMGVAVWVPWTEQPDSPRAGAEPQRTAAVAELQRLNQEIESKTKEATDAEAQRKSAEAEHKAAEAELKRVKEEIQAAQVEQQRLAALKEEQQRQAKAAADVEPKPKSAEGEQQRLAALKAEEQRVDAKLKAAELEQQRLKDEVQRKATAEAEAKRKAAEAEQYRLAAVKAEEERKAKAEAEVAARSAALPQPAPTATKECSKYEVRWRAPDLMMPFRFLAP
jgi:hypothetical protein